MAKLVLTNAYVSINGTDVSANIKQVTLPLERDAVDQTAMGSGTKISAPGLKSYSIELEAYNDFAASALDSILYPLFDAGTAFAVVIKPVAASVSTSNPSYTGTCFIQNYTPIGGSVGENAMTPIKLTPTAALVRATS